VDPAVGYPTRGHEDLKRWCNLPNAILLSLVATFDSHFSEIVKFFLATHPERYKFSDKPISLKEIFTKNNLEEVIDQVIENEVNDVMRGSHTDQIRFIEDKLDVKIIECYVKWPRFVEIFERRNLVAHGDLVVNKLYTSRCREAKLNEVAEIGSTLNLDPKYLREIR
jgi:hypothetical protein